MKNQPERPTGQGEKPDKRQGAVPPPRPVNPKTRDKPQNPEPKK